jgi:3-oxoadipate enol-lactonase
MGMPRDGPSPNLTHPMNREERGEREYRGLIGGAAGEDLADIRAMAPDMYHAVVAGAFGGTLANAELERAARELVTVAMLAAAGGVEPQLATHFGAALRLGVAPSELRALCEHVSVYAGVPRALNALRVLDRVLGDASIARPASVTRMRLSDHETVVATRGEQGPSIVLLHALALDWQMWEPIMARLAVGRRVVAYDLRGHGRAAGSPTPFTMDEIAADLIRVLDVLELERAHVVGLSYGGGVAQTAAVRCPERFASLALLATTDFPFAAFEDRARSGEEEGMEAQVVPSLTRWFTLDDLAVNGWGVRYARERVRRTDAVDWAAAWRSFQGLDVQDRLRTFRGPALVLAGEHDASTTPEIMAAIAERIPGSIYRELPGTPHMQTLSKPDLVAAALDEFLAHDAGG